MQFEEVVRVSLQDPTMHELTDLDRQVEFVIREIVRKMHSMIDV